jgi:localization factor PodJL
MSPWNSTRLGRWCVGIAWALGALSFVVWIGAYLISRSSDKVALEGEAAFDRKDYAAALPKLQAAAAGGDANAEFDLGCMYWYGHLVAKDPARASKYFLQAAQQDIKEAQFDLAVIYDDPDSGLHNQKDAAVWYRQAAEHGMREAQYNLGVILYNGSGVKADTAEGYEWIALAANQGLPEGISMREKLWRDLPPDQVARGEELVKKFHPRS